MHQQQGSRQALERGWRQDQLRQAVRLSVYWGDVEGILGGEQIVMVSEAGVEGEKKDER